MRLIAWSVLLLALASCPPEWRDRARAEAPPGDRARVRPNVLILMGDDHGGGRLGIDDDAHARTPRLDALARQGVRFDRAFCNAPLCTPSRASIITGRLPHAAGVTRLTTPLPDDATTIGAWLGDLGYDTAALGKMHFNAHSGDDNHHGFTARLDTDDWQAALARQPVPGDHHQPWKPFHSPTTEWLNAAGRSYGLPDEAMESSFYVRAAEAFLRDHRVDPEQPRPAPFALVVSLYEPHAPFKFPDGWPVRVDPATLPDHPTTARDAADLPKVFASLTPSDRRGIAASYYTSLSYMDHQMGRVLDALEASGQADNTIVVYLGDNGYLLGEHGRFEKHCLFDQAVRVPLIVRWPVHVPAHRRTDALVELVDVVPTLLDLLGAPLMPHLHGRSLAPILLDCPDARGRDVVVAEFLENAEAMARTERYKLIVAAGNRQRRDGYAPRHPPTGPTERLYDLRADAGETTDLSGRVDLAPVVVELRRAILDRLRSTREGLIPVPPQFAEADALRWCLTPRD